MRNRLLLLLFASAVVITAAHRGGAQGQPAAAPADLLILNGKVYPGDGAAFQQAVAVRGNRIAAVGASDDLAKLRGPKTEVIDARGGAVLPGFNDAHAHMLSGGLEMENINLDGAQTLDEVQSRIRSFAAAHADRSWIRGRGWAYAPFPGGLPTRQQLDVVVPDRPAIMRCFDGHSVWVNSKALALAGITKDTPDPPNGTIVRDPRTGEPTGLLKESPASSLVTRLMPRPTRQEQRRALKAAIAEGLKFGVTSVTEASGNPDDFDVFDEARRAGDLSARVYYSLLVTPAFTQKDADRFDAVWKAHPDTPLLKTGIVKMFMDGVIETNTAVMLEPYVNAPNHGPTELHPRGIQHDRADAGPPRVADHGARARRRRGAHGLGWFRAHRRDRAGASAWPAPPHRAPRNDRPCRRPALRQARCHRFDAPGERLLRLQPGQPRRVAAAPWVPGQATSDPSVRRAAASGRASPTAVAGSCSAATGRWRRSMHSEG